MKLLKVTYYFFFTLFVLLFSAGYFLERLFMPTNAEVEKKINLLPDAHFHYDTLVNGSQIIGYAEAGNDTARKIIMIHGSPGGWNNYHMIFENEELLKNYHLIAIDRIGFGLSNGNRGEPDLHVQAQSIKPLCTSSQGGLKPILIGHSMGGPIVIKSAIDYGNELAGVISVAGSFDAKLEFKEWYRGLYKVFPINLFFARSLKSSNDELFSHKVELEKMAGEWQKITCRVTIIQGGKDNLVAPGNLNYAREKLAGKNAEFIFIENEDHFIPFTHPEPIYQAIRQMSR